MEKDTQPKFNNDGEFFIPPPDTQPEIISGVTKGIVNEEQIKNAVEYAYKEFLQNPPEELFTPIKKQTRYM